MNERPTVNALRAMTNADVLLGMLTNVSHASVYKDEVNRRIAYGSMDLRLLNNHVEQPQLPVSRLENLTFNEASKKCLALAGDPTRYVEFYRLAIEQLGWNGEFCSRDPEDAVRKVRAAIALNEPWEQLIPPAQNFYKAMRFAIVQFCSA